MFTFQNPFQEASVSPLIHQALLMLTRIIWIHDIYRHYRAESRPIFNLNIGYDFPDIIIIHHWHINYLYQLVENVAGKCASFVY